MWLVRRVLPLFLRFTMTPNHTSGNTITGETLPTDLQVVLDESTRALEVNLSGVFFARSLC
jgi:hypothetical protein